MENNLPKLAIWFLLEIFCVYIYVSVCIYMCKLLYQILTCFIKQGYLKTHLLLINCPFPYISKNLGLACSEYSEISTLILTKVT